MTPTDVTIEIGELYEWGSAGDEVVGWLCVVSLDETSGMMTIALDDRYSDCGVELQSARIYRAKQHVADGWWRKIA